MEENKRYSLYLNSENAANALVIFLREWVQAKILNKKPLTEVENLGLAEKFAPIFNSTEFKGALRDEIFKRQLEQGGEIGSYLKTIHVCGLYVEECLKVALKTIGLTIDDLELTKEHNRGIYIELENDTSNENRTLYSFVLYDDQGASGSDNSFYTTRLLISQFDDGSQRVIYQDDPENKDLLIGHGIKALVEKAVKVNDINAIMKKLSFEKYLSDTQKNIANAELGLKEATERAEKAVQESGMQLDVKFLLDKFDDITRLLNRIKDVKDYSAKLFKLKENAERYAQCVQSLAAQVAGTTTSQTADNSTNTPKRK